MDKHICIDCERYSETPECWSDNIKFGNGIGNDNIIECENYKPIKKESD